MCMLPELKHILTSVMIRWLRTPSASYAYPSINDAAIPWQNDLAKQAP